MTAMLQKETCSCPLWYVLSLLPHDIGQCEWQELTGVKVNLPLEVLFEPVFAHKQMGALLEQTISVSHGVFFESVFAKKLKSVNIQVNNYFKSTIKLMSQNVVSSAQFCLKHAHLYTKSSDSASYSICKITKVQVPHNTWTSMFVPHLGSMFASSHNLLVQDQT